MYSDLRKAREILLAEGCTCVLCREDTVYRCHERGVKPLLTILKAKTDTRGFSAADKVVGKAAAFLYCLLQVRCVYAPVMSRGAINILKSHGIEAVFDLETDTILSRAKDGLCPMEMATLSADNPIEALEIIEKTLAQLRV